MPYWMERLLFMLAVLGVVALVLLIIPWLKYIFVYWRWVESFIG